MKSGQVKVLTEVGGRILHGVLTCILSAHRAGLAFNGAFGTGNLWVHTYEGATTTTGVELVVSRVYVGNGIQPTPPLDDARQKADYRALRQVIEALFPYDDRKKTLHVGRIYKLLETLAEGNDVVPRTRRTHLLQAYASIVSSPVAVSTMCLNLKRFYDQLDCDGDQRRDFDKAMVNIKHGFQKLRDEVNNNKPLFEKVFMYDYDKYSGYEENGMGLLHFARNWFTHVPTELPGLVRTPTYKLLLVHNIYRSVQPVYSFPFLSIL